MLPVMSVTIRGRVRVRGIRVVWGTSVISATHRDPPLRVTTAIIAAMAVTALTAVVVVVTAAVVTMAIMVMVLLTIVKIKDIITVLIIITAIIIFKKKWGAETLG